MKELKKLISSIQKVMMRDELLDIQLTQTTNASGGKVNPKSAMFRSGNRVTPSTAPNKKGRRPAKEADGRRE